MEAALDQLGPLEARIMRLVWDRQVEQPVFVVRTILALMPDLAYTTVMTTLNRLAEKGILHVAPVPGQAGHPPPHRPAHPPAGLVTDRARPAPPRDQAAEQRPLRFGEQERRQGGHRRRERHRFFCRELVLKTARQTPTANSLQY